MYDLLGLPQGGGNPPKGFGLSLYSPDSRQRLEAAVAEAAAHDGGRFDLDLSIRHSSGDYIPVRLQGAVSYTNGVPALMAGTLERIELRRYAMGGGVGSAR